MNLDCYDTIILDCDGVIFDSNNLKIEAFRESLLRYDNNIVDQFIKYFAKNFGRSRYVFAREFIENFLCIDFNESLYNEILKDYSKKCCELYSRALLTDNFLSFIKKYQYKNIFIASGSDQVELREVFTNRNLEHYFVDIFGSPTDKSKIVKSIVSKYKNSIMIGDAKSDMLASLIISILYL